MASISATIVAAFGDYSRQCAQAFKRSTNHWQYSFRIIVYNVDRIISVKTSERCTSAIISCRNMLLYVRNVSSFDLIDITVLRFCIHSKADWDSFSF